MFSVKKIHYVGALLVSAAGWATQYLPQSHLIVAGEGAAAAVGIFLLAIGPSAIPGLYGTASGGGTNSVAP